MAFYSCCYDYWGWGGYGESEFTLPSIHLLPPADLPLEGSEKDKAGT
jgi:hypothetical protein